MRSPELSRLPIYVPAILVGDEEPHDGLAPALKRVGVVGFDDLAGRCLVAKLGSPLAKLVIENVRKALVENQRQDEVLELGGVRSSPNGTGRIPEPRFQSRNVQVLLKQAAEGSAPDVGLMPFGCEKSSLLAMSYSGATMSLTENPVRDGARNFSGAWVAASANRLQTVLLALRPMYS